MLGAELTCVKSVAFNYLNTYLKNEGVQIVKTGREKILEGKMRIGLKKNDSASCNFEILRTFAFWDV